MDKSLKHLSRLDLLELMVKLSEENDILVAENARLQQAVSAKPVMSRAAKVGSIAELALQANGFFDAAQHAADDYLREIKHMRDQVAARTASQLAANANQPVQSSVQAAQEAQMVSQASAQASAIVEKANSQAETTLADARARSEAMLAEARAKSETMLADATRQARSIVSRANHQADAVIQAAQADARQQAARLAAQAGQTADAVATSGDAAARRSAAPAVSDASSADAEPVRGRHARPAEGGRK